MRDNKIDNKIDNINNIGNRQIIIGVYAGDDSTGKGYYNKRYNTVKCVTEYGTMWVPIILQAGGVSQRFNKDKERVIIFILHPDYTPTESADQDPDGQISTEDLFGIIVNLPPQYCMDQYPEISDDGKSPTKILGGSNNKPSEYYSIGTEKSRLILSDDIALLKGPNGEISITNDGIVTTGQIKVGTDSKYGILQENQIANILPESAKVAVEVATGYLMPPYNIKTEMITNLIDDIMNITKGMK